jgi:hypothetical protein
MRNIRRRGQTWVFRVSGPDDGRGLRANLPVVVAALLGLAALIFAFGPLSQAMGSRLGAGVILFGLAVALLWAGYTVRAGWLESGRFAPYLVSIDRSTSRIHAVERAGGKLLWAEAFRVSKLHIVPIPPGSLPGSRLGGTTAALVYADTVPERPAAAQPHRDMTLLTTASEAELRALISALSGEQRFPTRR